MTAEQEIVIFPGHLCNQRMYEPLLHALPDIAAMRVADLYNDDSVEAIARRALSEARRTFVLIANSMGGAVALEALHQAPDRVSGLILIGTTARPEFHAQSSRRERAIGLTEKEDWAAMTKLYAPIFFHPDNRRVDPCLDKILAAMIGDQTAKRIRNQQKAFAARTDRRPMLASIQCPTLIICGREDAITPIEHSHELAAGIADSTLVVLEQCGHIPTLEQPSVTVASILHFLRQFTW